MRSGTKTVEAVQAASGRKETIYVAQFALLVICVAGVLLAMRSEPAAEQVILEHQISAYHDLTTTEQGTFNDLLTAALDIDAIHADTLAWPTVEELEFMYIAPFVRDSAWRQRGELQWRHINKDAVSQHDAAYAGLSTDSSTSGSFLLWITHAHSAAASNVSPQTKIWYHPDDAAETPVPVQEQSLIAHGWREVVTYSGEDELRRLKGAGDEE